MRHGTPLIIDHDGRVWPAHSPDLLRSLGEGGDAVSDEHLVNARGYLRLDTFRSDQLVTFRPDITEPSSIVQVFFMVMEFLPKRIALKFFVPDGSGKTAPETGSWRQEIHGDIGRAMRRIEELIGPTP